MKARFGALAALLGVAFALVAAFCARDPEAGALYRVSYVAAAIGGGALLWWVYSWWRPSTRALVLWAVGLRLVFAPLLPGLSNDGYRYLWDGMLQSEGVSPYAYVPSDPALSEWHELVLFERMNSPHYHSVYPPVTQLGFRIASLALPWGWEGSWYLWKALVLLAEGVGLWTLIRFVGPRRSMLYALHPVVLTEVAGQAHTEALLIGALGLIILALRKSLAVVPSLVAGAVWVKLWPAAWVPLVRRSKWGLASGVTVLVGLSAAYDLHLYAPNVIESLRLYAGTFDFYSLPYRLLKSVLYGVSGEGAGQIAASALTAVWAGVCAYAWLVTSRSTRSVVAGVVTISVAYAMTSSTLHPWHVLMVAWIMPLLHNQKPLTWFLGVAPATYLTYTYSGTGDVVTWIGWGGAALLLASSFRRQALRAVMRRRARGKLRLLSDALSGIRPGARVLDLGAGEGVTGREVGDRFGVTIEAVDVADFSDPSGPQVAVYDGQTLSASDDAYDATIIVYVLHHAADPEAVLREARRVTRGPIIILETISLGPASRRWLEAVDRLVNRVRSGGQIDEEPLAIRTDTEWLDTFGELGLRIVHREITIGLHPKALYVLDPTQPSDAMTVSADRRRASASTASG